MPVMVVDWLSIRRVMTTGMLALAQVLILLSMLVLLGRPSRCRNSE